MRADWQRALFYADFYAEGVKEGHKKDQLDNQLARDLNVFDYVWFIWALSEAN